MRNSILIILIFLSIAGIAQVIEKTIEIPEVVISEDRKLKKKVIGLHRYLSVAENVAEIDKQTEWALLFMPNRKWRIVEELYLKLDEDTHAESEFIVRLREVGVDGMPARIVYEKSLKFNEFKEEKYVTVEVDTMLRLKENGIYLCLEVLDSTIYVRMTAKRRKEIGVHFLEGNEDGWKVSSLSREVKGWTPWIPRFGIRLRNY